MKFSKVLKETLWILFTEKQVSYQRLRLEFDLDDAHLEGLRQEFIQVKCVAADQDGEFLVWAGSNEATKPASSPPAAVSRKPLPAVRESKPAAPAETQPAAEASAEVVPLPVKTPASDAERRQLTVMFCDLVGSTALSTQLDPEDLRELIQVYQKTCAGVIERYEGFIAKYMGDGVLVYFGYPQATEFDAERALRTSLAIVDAIRELNTDQILTQGVELAVRIGLATGVVVVGDLIGEGASEERNVVGETPNLAARLQGLAQPNGIVIGSVTKDLAGDGFIYEELGAHELKGITGQVKAWGVIGGRELDEADVAMQNTRPLVGRQEELGLLQRAWSQSHAGQGQVVLISGEAGIGKTRLVETLGTEVRAAGFIRTTLRCSPYHTNSPLYPVIEHLQRLLGWARDDNNATKLAKLEQALSRYEFSSDETIPLFAALFSLTLPEGCPVLTLTPEQQRSRTLDEIVAWLFEEAERQPVLQVWEDLNWADPTTLELIGLQIEQCPTVALMIVMTYRPEFSSPWPLRSHLTPLTLNRLERTEVEQLITHHAGGKALPAEVVQHIADKADGVPMYVEELTKTIIESDFLSEQNDRYELTGPLSELSIPSTLQDSLTARLDRLPSGREVAQLGAVLGREFAYEVIRALSALAEPELHEGLNQLVEAELLYQRGRPPRAKYIFKQALIQDAAYQLLLKRTRQQYHQQVAELLEIRFTETVATHPELLAHHYSEAGNHTRALDYWQQAGERAVQRAANLEAIDHLHKALELLQLQPENTTRTHRELALQVSLAEALSAARGYANPEVGEVYTQALELCHQLGELPQQLTVLRGLWIFHFVRGDLPKARALSEQCFALTVKADASDTSLEGHHTLGDVLFCLGEFDQALEHLDKSIALFNPEQHRSNFLYGAIVGVLPRCFAAHSLWYLGYPERAVQCIEQALALARELSHPFSLALALDYTAMLHQFRGEAQKAQEWAEAAIKLCAEKGYAYYLAWGTIIRGWALVERGGGADEIEHIRQGLADLRATGAALRLPYYLVTLAEASAKASLIEDGLADLAEAEQAAQRYGECWCEAERCRLQAELLLTRTPHAYAEAETCLKQAIEVARRQQAKSLELRAVMSLYRLRQQHGDLAEARDSLQAIYAWFTEGFDTADLKDAKVLLDELA